MDGPRPGETWKEYMERSMDYAEQSAVPTIGQLVEESDCNCLKEEEDG